ncbi:sugar kinase [Galbibacter sp. EGI 63066]|uniref:sugar kinase n=1 Tax=Galbibacter sp. EGI 63066 TaxID=2993559 RepID=UPI002248D4A4|nr:sugar kinase [Galbibacter sp. EGI 63066]MCX2681121.1 sugar kinase [Galbibacter sp. EGI 63066]
MGKVVTFGEVIMRLSPLGNKKFQQSEQLEYFFGGTEMNVAASLANFGMEVKQVSNVSNDLVGDAALKKMRQYGIDVSAINVVDHPMGLYFLEVGSSIRSSRIAYNRSHGAFSKITPNVVDWNAVLDNCELLHWTGISPGISEGAYETLKEGLIAAKERGIEVTADPAYRKNLWNYGKEGKEILAELVSYSTVFIGGVNEINEILGEDFSNDQRGFEDACIKLKATCPSITKIFDKIRSGGNASWQSVYGRAWVNDEYVETSKIEITHVVDRIGTGDAFAAGLIYGLKHFDDHKALRFANAACAMKHTIPGDVNLVSVDEVLEIEQGNLTGRIKR